MKIFVWWINTPVLSHKEIKLVYYKTKQNKTKQNKIIFARRDHLLNLMKLKGRDPPRENQALKALPMLGLITQCPLNTFAGSNFAAREAG